MNAAPSSPPTVHPPRETSLDFIRGTAVLLMILAHAVYFFHSGSNWFLNALGRTGNLLCFSLFLFVAGAAAFYASIRDEHKTTGVLWRASMRRAISVLFGFYVVGTASLLVSTANLTLESFLSSWAKLVLWQNLPPFSEFLIPFVIFALLTVPLRRFYHKCSHDLMLTLVVSYLVYLVACLLYPIVLASPWNEYKALLVGEQGLNRFPLMQYFPIYLIGLWFGRFISHERPQWRKSMAALIAGIVFAVATAVCWYLSNHYPLQVLDPLLRWPPSVGFLMLGLTFSFLLYVFYHTIKIGRKWMPEVRLVYYLGKDAFDLYVVHLLLLFCYQRLWGTQFGEPWVVLVWFAGLFVSTVVIASLNWKTNHSIFRLNADHVVPQSSYRFTKRMLIGAVLFSGLVWIIFNYNGQASTIGGSIDKSEIVGSDYEPLPAINGANQATVPWYDGNFAYARQLSARDQDLLVPIDAKARLMLHFDHSALVKASKSLADGKDLQLVYFAKNQYKAVPFSLANANTDKAEIVFASQERIYPGTTDNRYFLYYGGASALDRELLSGGTEASHFETKLGDEMDNGLQVSVNRLWFLRRAPMGVSSPPVILIATAVHAQSATYAVSNTTMTGVMDAGAAGEFSADIDPSTLPAGNLDVVVTAKQQDGTRLSRIVRIMVSEPVLVAWTMDWEGWDVPQANLDAITAQVKRHHDLPLTHFFNPRIYLADVMTKARADYLTKWVTDRSGNYGDEIELHLHMQDNMVQAAGVTPRSGPRWGYKSSNPLDSGYDTKTTAYSATEFNQMLHWAESEFNAHGLPQPSAYRAGGWFINTAQLNVLRERGYLFDASGREKKMWNGKVLSPWDLTATTQPFFPSTSNQNKPATTVGTFMEIPNNGADAYAYTAEQMLARYQQNYAGGEADSQKVIVFLSHPIWEQTDLPKMDLVLGTTDQSLFSEDAGPVVYVTLKEVYDLWSFSN